jgi:mannose-1-phosphate guanylyltransferase
MEHLYALIMAGGGGTRLWPMSRSDTPKQFLPLVEEDTMLRVSVTRLAPLFTPDRIFVVAGKRYAEKLHTDVPEIPLENFILEPSAKDSAPAAALGVATIHKRDPNATIAILTADHHIADKEGFRNSLETAAQLAQKDFIVTLGIAPSFPSTAFGYIRRGDAIGKLNGLDCYHSLGFTEKPNQSRAMEFILGGDYSWNSGMFIWRADRAMGEFQRQQPSLYSSIQKIVTEIDTVNDNEAFAAEWEKIEKISLDFAVMEHAENMAVIPVQIGWSDVGSWNALFEVLELDENGNGSKGASSDWIAIDTKNTLVYSDKLVVTIGIEDLIVVETADAVLVCSKDRSQDVKNVVETLKAQKKVHYL